MPHPNPKFSPQSYIGAPKRSPGVPNIDGSLVLYKITSYDLEKHQSYADIRLLNVKTKAETTIIKDASAYGMPVWLERNGTQVVFLRQIGMEGEQRTDMVIGEVDNFEASCYVAGTIEGAADNLKITKLGPSYYGFVVTALANPDGTLYSSQSSPRRHSSARLYSSLFVRHWDHWIDRQRTSLWYGALLGSGRPEGAQKLWMSRLVNALKGTGLDSDDFDLNRDGLVFVTRDPDLNPSFNTKCHLYRVRLANYLETTPQLDEICLPDAYQGLMLSPRLSPNGRHLAVRAQKSNGYDAEDNKVVVFWDYLKSGRTIEVKSPEVSAEGLLWDFGNRLWFHTVEQAETSGLYLVTNTDVLRDIGSNGTFEEVVALKSTASSTSALFVTSSTFVDSSIYSSVQFTFASEHKWMATERELVSSLSDHGVHFGLHKDQAITIRYPGSNTCQYDGNIQAWILRPSFFDPAKKYPVLFLIHGGPQWAWMNMWCGSELSLCNALVFCEQGYVVVAPNITGSTTFGTEFKDSIASQWGGYCYQDIVKTWEHIENNLDFSYIDLGRAAALGSSFGGYMVNWIQGQPLGRKFRTLVTVSGFFSMVAQLAMDEQFFPYQEFGGALPLALSSSSSPGDSEVKRKWDRWDPSRYMDKWATPHLILHGEKDYRVGMAEGMMAFNVLQARGVESKFLVFEDEGHTLNNPENAAVAWKVVLEWLNQHLEVEVHDTVDEADERSCVMDPKSRRRR